MFALSILIPVVSFALAWALLQGKVDRVAWLGAAGLGAGLVFLTAQLMAAPAWPDARPALSGSSDSIIQTLLSDGTWALVELKSEGLGSLDLNTGELTRWTPEEALPILTPIEEVIATDQGVVVQYMAHPGERRNFVVTPGGVVPNAVTGQPYADFASGEGMSWDAEAKEVVVAKRIRQSSDGTFATVRLRRFQSDWTSGQDATWDVQLPAGVSVMGPPRWAESQVHWSWLSADSQPVGIVSCSQNPDAKTPGACQRVPGTLLETLVPGSAGYRVTVPSEEGTTTVRYTRFEMLNGVPAPRDQFETDQRSSRTRSIETDRGVLEVTRIYHPHPVLGPERGSQFQVRRVSAEGTQFGPEFSSGPLYRPTITVAGDTVHILSTDGTSGIRVDAESLERLDAPGPLKRLRDAVLRSPAGHNRSAIVSAILGGLALLGTLFLIPVGVRANRRASPRPAKTFLSAYLGLTGSAIGVVLWQLFLG